MHAEGFELDHLVMVLGTSAVLLSLGTAAVMVGDRLVSWKAPTPSIPAIPALQRSSGDRAAMFRALVHDLR